ncbi:hypothetical protein Q3G72_012650 [Acer saccharum]|nr:hypothetical protein Q3G72_012650 [Acer saccharum]
MLKSFAGCCNLLSSSYLTTQLISVSSLFKSVDYSLYVFNHFPLKNLPTFNALIRGLAKNSRFQTTLSHFILMLRSSVRPDRLTYPFVLKSVANFCLSRLGKAVHCSVVKYEVDFNTFVRVSLVDMYVKVEELRLALKMLDENPKRNKCESIFLWNVLINGCCKVGDLEKVVELFEGMPERNLGWNSLIKGFMGNGIGREWVSFLGLEFGIGIV